MSIDNGVWYIWDSGSIHFKCFSWDSVHTVDLEEGPFEDYMWGLVTGLSQSEAAKRTTPGVPSWLSVLLLDEPSGP